MSLLVRQSLAAKVLLLLAFDTAFALGNRPPMPNFTATTMEGEKFSNDAVKGKVVLLQFWTTWCQYCRSDQSALDQVSQEYADKNLLVLAVNAGESRKKVKQYLVSSPRAVRIVLMENTN